MIKENLNPDIQAKINSLLQGETMGQAMLQVFNLIIDVITSLDKDKLDLECEAGNYETGDTKLYRLVFTLTDGESTKPFEPDYAVHPGESVKELQAHLGLSFEEMAEKLELYKTELQGLYDGDAKITHHIAAGLAELSNTSTHFWLNLQSNYDKHTERLERAKSDT